MNKTDISPDLSKIILDITRSTARLPHQKRDELVVILAVQCKTVKQVARLLEKEKPTGWKEGISHICNLTGYGYIELDLKGESVEKILSIGCSKKGSPSIRKIWDGLVEKMSKEIVPFGQPPLILKS